jgi:hypothetical protein
VQDLKQELGRITEECSGDQAYEAESNRAHPAVSLPTIHGAEHYARDNHANGPDHSKCDFKKFEHIFCLLLKRRRFNNIAFQLEVTMPFPPALYLNIAIGLAAITLIQAAGYFFKLNKNLVAGTSTLIVMIGLWFAVQTAREEALKERASQQRLIR